MVSVQESQPFVSALSQACQSNAAGSALQSDQTDRASKKPNTTELETFSFFLITDEGKCENMKL